MAQAVTIECVKNGEHFASLWFRWGAYTSCVYHIGKGIIDGLKKRGYTDEMSINDVRKLLLDILEKDFTTPEVTEVGPDGKEFTFGGTHGGMDCHEDDDGNLTELEFWKSIGVEPILDNISSSDGLISVSNECMGRCYENSCAVECLDFDAKTFSNHNFPRWFAADAADDYDLSEEEIAAIPELDTEPLEDFSWDEIDDVMKEFAGHVAALGSVHAFIGKEPISGDLISVDL